MHIVIWAERWLCCLSLAISGLPTSRILYCLSDQGQGSFGCTQGFNTCAQAQVSMGLKSYDGSSFPMKRWWHGGVFFGGSCTPCLDQPNSEIVGNGPKMSALEVISPTPVEPSSLMLRCNNLSGKTDGFIMFYLNGTVPSTMSICTSNLLVSGC